MSQPSDQGFDPRIDQRDLLKAWESFVDSGVIDADLVPEQIAESWRRARDSKIDPVEYTIYMVSS